MKCLILFFLPLCLVGQGNFTPVSYNQVNLNEVDYAKYIDNGKAALLTDGQVYEMNINSEYGYSINYVENGGVAQDIVLSQDLNGDGIDDLLTTNNSGGQVYNYYTTPERFDYFNSITNGRSVIFDDFDGDGKDELIVDGYVYKYNDDGSRERIYRRTPGNTNYLFKTMYVMDVDQDGDDDILFNLGRNIGYFERDSTDVLKLKLISQFNESCTWLKILDTNEGPQVVYFHSSAAKIKKIIFDNGTYSSVDLVSDQPNYGFDVEVGDLDRDGNDELLMFFDQANWVYAMSYNPTTEEVIYKKHELGDFMTAFIREEDEEAKLLALSPTTLSVYSFDEDQNFLLEKTTVSSMTINAKSFVDINGDGYTDMVNPALQRRYLGDGNFSQVAEFEIPEPGGYFEDYDNDGDADYIIEDRRYENVGDGIFAEAVPNPDFISYPDPDIFFTEVIYEGDMDGDGDIDLLSYNIFGEPLMVHENIDNQYFEDGIEIADSDVLSGDLKGVRLMDVDQDGDQDILMIVASGMIWFAQEGALQFGTGKSLYEGDFRPISFAIDDIDDDGFQDIVLDLGRISAGTAYGQTRIYQGSDSGPVMKNLLLNTTGYKTSAFINYDDIGVKDILVSDGASLRIYSLDEIEDSQPAIKVVTTDYDNFGNFLVNDVDNDGDEDIIVYGETALRYFLKDEENISSLCPQEDVFIYNKSQLESYRARFFNCTEIAGSLAIGGLGDWTDITELSALSNITRVNGNLSFGHILEVKHFAELENLDTIGGSLVFSVIRPTSFSGFRNLKYIGENFICNNLFNSLTDFNDFESLAYIGGGVDISYSYIEDISQLLIGNKINGDLKLSTLDNLIDLSYLESIDTVLGTVDIRECGVYDLTSLRNIEYLEGVFIANPNCESVELNTKVDTIKGDYRVQGLYSMTNLNQTNNLKYIGGDFNINSESVGSWDDLESVGDDFFINTDVYSENSFKRLTSIGGSMSLFTNNEYGFSNFEKLKYIGNNLSIDRSFKSLSGLDNLDTIGGNIFMINNDNLTDITSLSDDLYVGDTWFMNNNPNLNACDVPALCNHIKTGGEVDIWNNGALCDDISDIKCIGQSISGVVFYDYNQDGIRDDKTDASLANIKLYFDDMSQSMITSDNGFYQRFLLSGQSYDVQIEADPAWSYSTNSTYVIDSFIPESSANIFDFGLYKNQLESEFSSSLSTSLFVCDRPFDLHVNATNLGAQISEGYIEILYAEELSLSPDFTAYTSHDEEGRSIILSYDSLYPYFNLSHDITFIAPTAADLGNESIFLEVNVVEVNGSQETVIHSDDIFLGLLCAYDPNDKLVSSTDKSGKIRVNETDDELIYTIRFQNTGNFYAEDIRITDEVAENLDLSTFQFLSSSHDVSISIRERELTFMFEDIFLTDSTTSFIESQGFVSFSIKPFSYMLDEQFDNQAKIYFDFNEPIITNIAESIVYDPTVAISDITTQHVKVYPNPVSEVLTIDISNADIRDYKLSVVNITGQKIKECKPSSNAIQSIDMSEIPNGYYIIMLTSNNGKRLSMPLTVFR